MLLKKRRCSVRAFCQRRDNRSCERRGDSVQYTYYIEKCKEIQKYEAEEKSFYRICRSCTALLKKELPRQYPRPVGTVGVLRPLVHRADAAVRVLAVLDPDGQGPREHRKVQSADGEFRRGLPDHHHPAAVCGGLRDPLKLRHYHRHGGDRPVVGGQGYLLRYRGHRPRLSDTEQPLLDLQAHLRHGLHPAFSFDDHDR